MGDNQIESVTEFPYLGSAIASSGRMLPDIDQRIDLRVETKCMVYQACVLSTLLYRSECWTPHRKDLRKLDSFHHRCIHTVGSAHNINVRKQWGDSETVVEGVSKCQLEWLGHLHVA